jgi:hypothetical protein
MIGCNPVGVVSISTATVKVVCYKGHTIGILHLFSHSNNTFAFLF